MLWSSVRVPPAADHSAYPPLICVACGSSLAAGNFVVIGRLSTDVQAGAFVVKRISLTKTAIPAICKYAPAGWRRSTELQYGLELLSMK